MKTKIAIVILAVASLGLGIALFATKKQADDQHVADTASIVDFSNQLVSANLNISELHQVNLALTNDLAASQQTSEQFSNSLAAANSTLADTRSTLADTRASLSVAQDQITNLNTHITDLELQNRILDERASELTNTIAQLNSVIEETQSKLALSETNEVFLQGELQKQMAQRAELEHKFNDLDEVRAQVKKLRDELFVARRLQLMKNDNTGKKGGELQIKRTVTVTNVPPKPPNYDLNVEVGSDGSVRVIPPLGSATNSAAH